MLQLPQLAGEPVADVCVVGLGGSGLACIHAFIAAGRTVVGVDAVSVAAGAAGRNGGFLLGGLSMFHHDAVTRLGQSAATAIYAETLAQIARMATETPDAVRATGTLRIALSEEELDDCARQFEAMRRDNLPVERYSGFEGTGLLFPADAAFDPVARCVTLAARAVALGARLFGHSPVIAIDDTGVVTAAGRVVAQHVIVAVDGHLESILPELSPRVRTARLQMLATTPAHGVNFPRPVYARWGLDYWQQLPDRRVVVGGFRDSGSDAEWTTHDQPSEVVQAELTNLLRGRLGVREPVSHRWAANVGYTTSGLPVFEEVRPHVWAIGAYSGTGNVIGALCGRAVAEKILAGRSRVAELLSA